jgi:hypothetical protein
MDDRLDDEGDGLTPAAAFALLGEPTRLAIVRAVWNAPTDVVSFSELRDRVGVDDTGRFNYHLGKLRGHFLRKADDGYELRQAGVEVVRAVLAGVINEAPIRETAPIDATCPDCADTLTVRYDGHGTVACRACDTVWMHDEFPPAGLVGRGPDELARALDRWTRSRSLLAFEGVCPSCASETTAGVEEADGETFVDRVCDHCGYVSRAPLWALVAHHPDVSAFFHEHGVEVRTRPFWELAALPVERDRTDDGVVLRFVADEETLRVVLDADRQVQHTARET